VPFPDPEPKKETPPPAPTRAPADPVRELVEGRTLLLRNSGTKAILDAVWSEIVKDKRIPGKDKATLQGIYDQKKKDVR